MHNYVFDLEEWLKRIPLERPTVAEGERINSGSVITGPCDICNNEHLRRELHEQYDWGKPVPADIFIWADGEPVDRHVTKLGGLPYLPPEEGWPGDSNGKPLTFVGQINFTDSKDLTGELPGDLLLVFAEWIKNEHGYEYMKDIVLQWQNKSSKTLISPEQIPKQAGLIKPTYGYRCRISNYPDSQELYVGDYPTYGGGKVWADYFLQTYQATQIGGEPFFIQSAGSSAYRPLCVISSIQPEYKERYPFVNRAEPVSNEREDEDKYLMISDMGCLYIFIDDEGDLHWTEESY